MKISNFFIKKKIQELAHDPSTRTPRFCSVNDAGNILIVFNLKDKEEVMACMEQLSDFTGKIHLCAYVPKKHSDEAVNASWFYVHEEELDSGLPTEGMIEKFNTIPADILIDLIRTNNYAMQYLQLKHPSLFKVGNKSISRDLTIPMNDKEDIRKYFEHILYYLLTIRSK